MRDYDFARVVAGVIVAGIVMLIAWAMSGAADACGQSKCPPGLHPQVVRTSVWNRYETKCVCVATPEGQ